jgi:hypothetical protein
MHLNPLLTELFGDLTALGYCTNVWSQFHEWKLVLCRQVLFQSGEGKLQPAAKLGNPLRLAKLGGALPKVQGIVSSFPPCCLASDRIATQSFRS